MGQGDVEEKIAEICRREGRELPRAIAEAPSLLSGLELYLLAYKELATCRPVSFCGVAPVPWTATREYAREHDLDAEQTELLNFFVGRIDEALRAHCEARDGARADGGIQSPDSRSGRRAGG